jgi:hypothetical protein
MNAAFIPFGLVWAVPELRESTLVSVARPHGAQTGRDERGRGSGSSRGPWPCCACVNDQHATAVQLFGEGDGDNEERLELRARSAAAIGPGTVLRAGRGQFSAALGNHTNGLLRIPGIGSRPYVMRRLVHP